MGDDTVYDLFLFRLDYIIYVASLMELGLAAVIALLTVKDLIYTDCLITAGVLVLGAQRRRRHLDLGRRLMETAESHLSNRVVLHATVTFDEVQIGPDLPVDLLPGNTVGLTDEGYELLKIPIFVDDMLGPHLAVRVDKAGSLAAGKDLSLLLGEELVAVGTLVEMVFLFL